MGGRAGNSKAAAGNAESARSNASLMPLGLFTNNGLFTCQCKRIFYSLQSLLAPKKNSCSEKDFFSQTWRNTGAARSVCAQVGNVLTSQSALAQYQLETQNQRISDNSSSASERRRKQRGRSSIEHQKWPLHARPALSLPCGPLSLPRSGPSKEALSARPTGNAPWAAGASAAMLRSI